MLVDDEALAAKLQGAVVRDIKLLALEVDERETIIRVLDDSPKGLTELRATLLLEHAWRAREGLA